MTATLPIEGREGVFYFARPGTPYMFGLRWRDTLRDAEKFGNRMDLALIRQATGTTDRCSASATCPASHYHHDDDNAQRGRVDGETQKDG